MRIDSMERFEAFQVSSRKKAAGLKTRIMVCCGPGCLASGSRDVADAFENELKKRGLLDGRKGIAARKTGCHGLCEAGPLVAVEPAGILYTRVKPRNVPDIIEKTVLKGEVIERLLFREGKKSPRIPMYKDIPFYSNQVRVSLRNVGRVDPFDLEDAVANGAYSGLAKALNRMTPDEVVEEVERSGLRGRGGAGFATGRKWRACRSARDERKLAGADARAFVICNGDEGDPGAFKDRAIMEGDPHSVLEGMIIGAYAVGAHEGYIYVRHEYPLAVVSLEAAIRDAREAGLLGEDILSSGFDFDVRISRGGGAFVCGESSALMRSIEGKVGEPRAKYVHGTDKGLYDLPTVLNNVESWSHVGAILHKGADWFASMGTPRSKGAKAFSLVGKVRNTGLIELPMGTTLRRIIYDIGGGIQGDRPFKAVQTGGPSGGVIPESLLDLPVDYEELEKNGSMMGSGGMIVMDDRTCMVDVARYFINFLIDESCGKCVPCREGLKQMRVMLDRLTSGKGQEGDIERIERLASGMKLGSLCDLGRSATNPVLSTLRHFRSEYVAHIRDKACPAGVCRDLTAFEILPDVCDGCHLCVKACPVDAIVGEPKKNHHIETDKCTSCGECFNVCPINAIRHFPKTDQEVA